MSYNVGDVGLLPFIEFPNNKIDNKVIENIALSRLDWDSHETSWDFEENPLVALANRIGGAVSHRTTEGNYHANALQGSGETPHLLMADLVAEFEADWTEKFMQLHANEEQLNREFISIYGLEDELSPDVPLSEITILQQGEVTIEK